jgi:hypothetical protein
LKDFHRKWASPNNNLTIYGLSATELQKTLDSLLVNFKLSQAHRKLNHYLKDQEAHIKSSIKTMANQIEHTLKLNVPRTKSYQLSPAAMAATQRYLNEINKLEENIYGTSHP